MFLENKNLEIISIDPPQWEAEPLSILQQITKSFQPSFLIIKNCKSVIYDPHLHL